MAPPSQSERREATRSALVKAGRRLFGTHGFGEVPADEIVAEAGVTRGALHYHFGDKRGLFEAVFEELEAEIAHELTSSMPQDQLNVRAALSTFLEICQRPEVARIALTDAPAVLGWKTWREIESRYGLGLLTTLLAEGRDPNAMPQTNVLAQLLLGSVIEGALLVAAADDQREARHQVEASLTALFHALNA